MMNGGHNRGESIEMEPDVTNSASSSPPVDGSDFLSHLRAAGDFNAANDNNATVGATNKQNPRQDLASLNQLFRQDDLDSQGMGTRKVTSTNIQTPTADSIPNVAAEAASVPPALKAPKLGSPSTSADDVLLVPQPASTGHTRGVSWGVNNTEYIPNDKTSRHNRKLTLQDLNSEGPYVEEAEASILRALEEQERTSSPESLHTYQDSLLSGVPDDAAHDFTSEGTKTKNTDDERSKHYRQASQESHNTAAERRKEDHRPLLSPRSHRRTMTVEDTLAGLTDAMSALHTSTRHLRLSASEESDDSPRTRRPSMKKEKSFRNSSTEEYTSVGQTFADNALRLNEDDEADARRKRARGMWQSLLQNLPALREYPGEQSDESKGRIDSTSEDAGRSSDSNNSSDEVCMDLEAQQSGGSNYSDGYPEKNARLRRKNRHSRVLHATTDKFKEDLEVWRTFFRPRRDTVTAYLKTLILYAIIPLVGIAACLFYIGENPIQGISEDGSTGNRPSVSWWFLFVVRLLVTFSLALATQAFIIDFLALGTKIMIRIVGPIVTLLVVQAKGWPFICMWWGIYNFALMFGNTAFAHHWLYWQDWIDLFNSKNPSGLVLHHPIYQTILTLMVVVSGVVAVKRFVIGLYLGRQTFLHYGKDLAKTMHKMVLVSEVANLAKSIEKANNQEVSLLDEPFQSGDQIRGITEATFSEDEDDRSVDMDDPSERIIRTENRDPLTGSLRPEEKAKLMQLLGRWEDPDAGSRHSKESASISAVLRFRKALTLISRRFPFSMAFGLADTREACIDSAQRVYYRLMLHTPNMPAVQFETLALTALMADGRTIDQQKAKDLVKVFRPDRDGNLRMLDFVKSVDSVYKEFKLLIASIENSSQIDRAFENILNIIFYAIVVTVILSQMGVNPLGIFLSLSSIILAFAFMIGSASSKYFEGLLFILVRRPYNIGDRIHVSNIESETSFDGSPGWTVEHVTLFETIARWVPTNEQASLSNGSLANSRIINWARSYTAQFHLFIKLPIETPYDKIVILKNAIEQYMRARPREWLSYNGFRANKIDYERAFVEYMIVIQHREAWQNIGAIMDSKGNIQSYMLEVMTQLGLRYKAPPLPVTMKTLAPHETEENPTEVINFDADKKMQDFKEMTHKHNIRLG